MYDNYKKEYLVNPQEDISINKTNELMDLKARPFRYLNPNQKEKKSKNRSNKNKAKQKYKLEHQNLGHKQGMDQSKKEN